MVCGELSAWKDGNTQQVELHRVASWDGCCLLRCSQPLPPQSWKYLILVLGFLFIQACTWRPKMNEEGVAQGLEIRVSPLCAQCMRWEGCDVNASSHSILG